MVVNIQDLIVDVEQNIKSLMQLKSKLNEMVSTETKKEVVNVTLEQVRATLAEKSRDGLTSKVKELIQSYGVERLSDIDKKYYPELLEKTKELSHDK